MKLYLVFNTNKLKSYYENTSTKQEVNLEIVEGVEE